MVQRIFNANPKTLVWGEQGGIITNFLQIKDFLTHFSLNSAFEKHAFFDGSHKPNTWTANMTPDLAYIDQGVIASIQAMFDKLYAQYRDAYDRVGFKEVRYGQEEILLLRQCFQHAVILLLVRNPLEVWKSETVYWSNKVEVFCNDWNRRALEYDSLHSPDQGIYLLRYEDIINRDPNALKLLGDLAEVSGDTIESVLSVRLNSTRSERNKDELAYIRKDAKEGMMRFGYA